MEHYCGFIQAGLRSRTLPWANLNNRILKKTYIEQIDIYYGLGDKGSNSAPSTARGEIFPDCKKLFNNIFTHSLTYNFF